MSVRRRAVIGLLAAASLVLTGCAGEAVDDGPDEPSLTMPPEESTSTSADTVLDLETMTDDELLAEAERAYQGFLDDVGSLRAAGEDDYSSLVSWATEDFAAAVDRVFANNIPENFTIEGAQALLGIELGARPVNGQSELVANICVDNTPVVVRNEQGVHVQRGETPDRFWGQVTFVLSEDASHFLIAGESADNSPEPELCGN